jgi:hypothetical protein
LHIDKVGVLKWEDADIVLWNNNPLSIYAKAEKPLLKELFIMTYKIQKGSNRRTQRVNRSITTRENKGVIQEPKKRKEYHCDSEELQ